MPAILFALYPRLGFLIALVPFTSLGNVALISNPGVFARIFSN
jgi:hypothetical protein